MYASLTVDQARPSGTLSGWTFSRRRPFGASQPGWSAFRTAGCRNKGKGEGWNGSDVRKQWISGVAAAICTPTGGSGCRESGRHIRQTHRQSPHAIPKGAGSGRRRHRGKTHLGGAVPLYHRVHPPQGGAGENGHSAPGPKCSHRRSALFVSAHVSHAEGADLAIPLPKRS